MTAQYKDVLGHDLYDYDLVWCADKNLLLCCVKAVVINAKRINPLYVWNLPPTTSKYIQVKEDKLLCVYSLRWGAELDLNETNLNIHTSRTQQSKNMIKIKDPYILNSALANTLIEETKRKKR